MKKVLLLTAGLLLSSTSALFAADKYTFDASHAQIVFSYKHLGYSTTFGMFSGFEGEINLDEETPGNSSVTTEFNVDTMYTGWEDRNKHFLSADFFDTSKAPKVTFKSTSVETTGDNTANIVGDLTLNGVTKPVTLATTMNKKAPHPRSNKETVGFDATTTIKRSDFNVGKYAPHVSDEVEIIISVEAAKAE